MISLIEAFFKFALFATPWIAGLALFVAIFKPSLRSGVFVGLGVAFLGGMIGLGILSGHDSGWGWGDLAAFVISLICACSGFLLGLGAHAISRAKERRWGGIFICSALLLPLAGLGITVKTRLLYREQVIWRGIVSTGKVDRPIDFYQSHFSEPTRRWMTERLGRTEQGLVPTEVLALLDQLGVDEVAAHPNLREELAWRIYRNPRNQWTRSWLAGNASLPISLQREFARSEDFHEFYALALNPKLDPELREALAIRFTELEKNAVTTKDYSMLSSCKTALLKLGHK